MPPLPPRASTPDPSQRRGAREATPRVDGRDGPSSAPHGRRWGCDGGRCSARNSSFPCRDARVSMAVSDGRMQLHRHAPTLVGRTWQVDDPRTKWWKVRPATQAASEGHGCVHLLRREGVVFVAGRPRNEASTADSSTFLHVSFVHHVSIPRQSTPFHIGVAFRVPRSLFRFCFRWFPFPVSVRTRREAGHSPFPIGSKGDRVHQVTCITQRIKSCTTWDPICPAPVAIGGWEGRRRGRRNSAFPVLPSRILLWGEDRDRERKIRVFRDKTAFFHVRTR